jgi:hypothetical protein
LELRQCGVTIRLKSSEIDPQNTAKTSTNAAGHQCARKNPNIDFMFFRKLIKMNYRPKCKMKRYKTFRG